VLALFALTTLGSAFLLFWIEPLFAKMVLPMLGGSPAVWNTCLMYFQSMLLLGYLYAHLTSRYLSSRRQAIVHVALLALAVAGTPASADQPMTNLGPVGPQQPILAVMGNQRVIAFYAPVRGECAVNAVMWKDAAADAPYASTRVRMSLRPGQMFELDGPQRQSMSLLCGADASTLAVVAPAELILTGTPGSN